MPTRFVVYQGMTYIPSEQTPEDMVQVRPAVRRDQSLNELLARIKEIIANPEYEQFKDKKIEQYIPLDMKRAAPSSPDPRTDDGLPPIPPSDVSMKRLADGSLQFTFKASASLDVVGYRLYRATAGPPFERTERVALTGQELKITDSAVAISGTSYLIVAVDVAGNESTGGQTLTVN
jgi:penicillin-binding protein